MGASSDQSLRHKKILFLVTEEKYFHSHRLALAEELCRFGAVVSVATNTVGKSDGKIGEISLLHFPWDRRGTGILAEGRKFCQLVRLLRKNQPELVINVALKPVLYGTMATFFPTNTVCLNLITGLGYIFTESSWKTRVFQSVLLAIFRKVLPRTGVIVQNADDFALFQALNLPKLHLVRGSGVDCVHFHPTEWEPPLPCTIVLPARMLWHKGVREFVEAARILREEGVPARFLLLGDTDPHNPAAVPPEFLRDCVEEGCVEWWEHQKDIAEVFAQAHVVCLPSYREGIPKALLEAAASGKPVVTTDSVGCREVVRHGDNGLLVPPRTVTPLVEALRTLIKDPELRVRMGKRGRERAEQEFSQERVLSETVRIIKGVLPRRRMR